MSGDITLAIPGAMESGQLSLLLGILQTLPVTASAVVHRSALVGAATGAILRPCRTAIASGQYYVGYR
jgi:cell division inhibitor SulA